MEYKTVMINILMFLLYILDSMQGEMDSVNRGMNILRKDEKEILQIKNTVTDINIAFD